MFATCERTGAIAPQDADAGKEPEATGQLYDLRTNPGETANLFFKEEAKRKECRLCYNS